MKNGGYLNERRESEALPLLAGADELIEPLAGAGE